MLKGFRDFIMRGNVVDLAVGIVIGAAFTGLVTTFTEKLLQPIIKRIGGGSGEGAGTVDIGGGQHLDWGAFVPAVINFAIVAPALYFLVVLPMNKLAERRRRGEGPPPEAPSGGGKLLTEIRDAPVRGGGPAAGQGPPGHPPAAP